MRAAIYARVSTEGQQQRGTIGSQLELLRAHVAEIGDELVAEFCDDGASGTRLDRPGLDAAASRQIRASLSPERLLCEIDPFTTAIRRVRTCWEHVAAAFVSLASDASWQTTDNSCNVNGHLDGAGGLSMSLLSFSHRGRQQA